MDAQLPIPYRAGRRASDVSPGRLHPPAGEVIRGPHRMASSLWWAHPSILILLVLLPIYLSVLVYDFRKHVPIAYVPGFDYWVGLVMLLSMVVGVQWALAHRHTLQVRRPPRVTNRVMWLLLLPTLLAYALWFGPVLARPELLLEVFRGERSEIRNDIDTIKGITTFTQWGVAYVIAYAIKAAYEPSTVTRAHRIGLALVFVLAAFRAFAWAERLALIELAICFGITRLSHLQVPAGWRSRAANVVPALAPLALFGLFTLSEYFRTWEQLQNQYSSVWALSLDRLTTYYATAVNNSIGALVEIQGWPFYSSAFALESLWKTPGLGELLSAAFYDPRWLEARWLVQFGNVAFNSHTAYFRIVLDLGYFGSVVYHLVMGYIIGRAYLGWQRGRVFGLLMYGVFVLHLLESLRFSYLAETRFVPLALGLAVLAWDIRSQQRR
jgi:uncharacterized integral membrane protein